MLLDGATNAMLTPEAEGQSYGTLLVEERGSPSLPTTTNLTSLNNLIYKILNQLPSSRLNKTAGNDFVQFFVSLAM